MDDRIEKLPKWAREIIAEKDREIVSLENKIKALNGSLPAWSKGVGIFSPLGHREDPVFQWGFYSHASFKDTAGQQIDVAVSDNGLRVRSCGRIVTQMVIHPETSNSILIPMQWPDAERR